MTIDLPELTDFRAENQADGLLHLFDCRGLGGVCGIQKLAAVFAGGA